MNEKIEKTIEAIESYLYGLNDEAYPLGGYLKEGTDKDFSYEMHNIYESIDTIRATLYEIKNKFYEDDATDNNEETDKPLPNFKKLLEETW